MKSTKVEVERRVAEVLKLRLGGAEFPDIRDYSIAPEQGWNVSDSQLWRYIQAADALCKKYFDARADHLLSRHLLQRRQLYAHAMEAGDFRTALAVLRDEAELESLYGPGKLQLTGADGRPLNPPTIILTDEQRDAGIKAILQDVTCLEQGDGGPTPDGTGDGGGSPLRRPDAGDAGTGDGAGPLAIDVAPLEFGPRPDPKFPPVG